ncbi:hypothetical protein ULO1_26110, partial [Carboxydocella sp. ULO1]
MLVRAVGRQKAGTEVKILRA